MRYQISVFFFLYFISHLSIWGIEPVNYFGIEGTEWLLRTYTTDPSGSSSPEISTIRYKTEHYNNYPDSNILALTREYMNSEVNMVVGYIKTVDQRVYFQTTPEDDWYLLYDFSLDPLEGIIFNEGLTISSGYPAESKFIGICLEKRPNQESLLDELDIYIPPVCIDEPVNGVGKISLSKTTWICGIGSINGPLFNAPCLYAGGGGTRLLKVTSCGKTIYDYGNEADIESTLPDFGQISISEGKIRVTGHPSACLYDSKGIRIEGREGYFDNLSPGIYILNSNGKSGIRVRVP